jgi:hypothetical protein
MAVWLFDLRDRSPRRKPTVAIWQQHLGGELRARSGLREDHIFKRRSRRRHRPRRVSSSAVGRHS